MEIFLYILILLSCSTTFWVVWSAAEGISSSIRLTLKRHAFEKEHRKLLKQRRGLKK